MKVNELIKQLQKVPGDTEILLGTFWDSDFEIWGYYCKWNKTRCQNDFYLQSDLDYFIKHEFKNDKYKDKKLVIIEIENNED